jgi:excisionase family DNA binding protein
LALPDDPDELLTSDELAKYLSIPVSTIRQWPSRDKGPRRMKVGRHVRYRVGDIREWLEKQYVD